MKNVILSIISLVYISLFTISCSGDDENINYSSLEFTKVEIGEIADHRFVRYGTVEYEIKGNIDADSFTVYFTILKNSVDTIATINQQEPFVFNNGDKYRPVLFRDDNPGPNDTYEVINERIEW